MASANDFLDSPAQAQAQSAPQPSSASDFLEGPQASASQALDTPSQGVFETPSQTVIRIQPKINAGTASEDERNQWLDARTADLQKTTLLGRAARAIQNAPYGKILPEIGGWIKNTTSDALQTGETLGSAAVNPTSDNLSKAGKAIGSAALGAVSEGGSIGKSILGLIGNAGISLNPFSHDSDLGPRIQAQSELQLSDILRNVDPGAVKALAPDQAAAGTGAAAVDVLSAITGPKGTAAAPEIAIAPPGRLMGVSAAKAIRAAQDVGTMAPSEATKAAANYVAVAIAKSSHPIISTILDTAKGASDLGVNLGKAVAPMAARTAAGAVIGGAVSGAAAAPGDTDEAVAGGMAGGAMAGAARSPKITDLANGVEPWEPRQFELKPQTSTEPVSRFAGNADAQQPATKLSVTPRPPVSEVQGPPEPNPAGVDEANAAARPNNPPLALAKTTPPTQPVSRFAGDAEAVGGLLDSARAGNALIRAELISDGQPTESMVKDQGKLADKPLATIGPVPEGKDIDPSALNASQNLGEAMMKQPGLDTFINTLFGGNRGGTGTQTAALRIHSLPDGSTFEVAGQKVQVVRPEGTEGVTILRTNNPQIPDIAVHQPTGVTSEGYTVPTDTGPVEVARVDPQNPSPMMIGGEPHQVISSKGMRDPLVLADSAGNKKIMASRQILNADKGTAPEAKPPVPMIDATGSSNLKSYGYDAATQTLYVQPKSGGLYMHEGVPIEVMKAMQDADSKGKFYNAEVKKKFPMQ